MNPWDPRAKRSPDQHKEALPPASKSPLRPIVSDTKDITWADPWWYQVGRPFVSVSPIGSSSGRTPNNGCDFGPDSPGTQTCGIQEAINLANGAAVILMPGIFVINEPITWQPPSSATFWPPFILTAPPSHSNTLNSTNPTWGCQITPGPSFPAGQYLIQVNANKVVIHTSFVEIRGIDFINGSTASVCGAYVYNANHAAIRDCHFEAFATSLAIDGSGQNSLVENVIVDSPGTVAFYNNSTETYYVGCTVYGNTATGGHILLDANSNNSSWIDCCFEGGSPSAYLCTMKGANGVNSLPLFSNCHVYNGTFTILFTVAVANSTPTVLVSNSFLSNYDAIFDVQSTTNAGITGYFVNVYAVGLGGATLQTSEVVTNNIGCRLTWLGGELDSTTYAYGSSGMSGNSIAISRFIGVKGVNAQYFNLATPGFPGSGNYGTSNPWPFTVRVYLTAAGSGVTKVVITDASSNRVTMVGTLVAGMYWDVDPNCAIGFDYTGSPTWTWYGT